MIGTDDAWAAADRCRRMRENAHLWIRPDAWRFMRPDMPRHEGKEAVRYFWPEYEADRPAATERPEDIADMLEAERKRLLTLQGELIALKAEIKFRQFLRKLHHWLTQPRVPAGNPDGGQWTTVGGGAGRNDPRVLSDATPDSLSRSGAQYVQLRPRGPQFVRIGSRTVEVSPGQAARLAEAQSRAANATARVRELDRNWRPKPGVYESAEGLIRAYQAEAREAQARLSELSRVGIGPGPNAGPSIPARGPERYFTNSERREINRIGSEIGCHTCGTTASGIVSGNFVPDHQPPSALNRTGGPQRLFPQCLTCSLRQGGWIRSRGLRR